MIVVNGLMNKMTFTNTLLYDQIRSRDSHVGYIIFEKVEKSKSKIVENKLQKTHDGPTK